MKKCKFIGKQFFINYEITYKLDYNKYYYYKKIIWSDLKAYTFTQYELYDDNIFITTVPKDTFEKQFLKLKQERKLKLKKINENW